MQSKYHVEAFQSYTEMLAESPVHVQHSGINGVDITVNNPSDYYEADEIAAENSFQDYVDSQGLTSMTLEDALNGNFPNALVEVNVEFSVNTDAGAVQNGNAIAHLKNVFQQAIKRLEELETNEDNAYYTYETLKLKKPGTDEELGELHIDISNDSD